MRNYHLSPAEQETIICWDNELDTADIYTHDRRIENDYWYFPSSIRISSFCRRRDFRTACGLLCLRAVSASGSHTAKKEDSSRVSPQRKESRYSARRLQPWRRCDEQRYCEVG